MTDGGRRNIQSRSGAPDMTLLHDRFEQHEQIEVDTREISFIQHNAEIISLDSS